MTVRAWLLPTLILVGAWSVQVLSDETSSSSEAAKIQQLESRLEKLESELKAVLFEHRNHEKRKYSASENIKCDEDGHNCDKVNNKAAVKKSLDEFLKRYPDVPYLNYNDRKRILITGGAGFVGSHLTDKLLMQGHEVIVADNFYTGRKRNLEHWVGHPNFEMINHDIVNPLYLHVDEIYHLASPASPPHYMFNPVKTVKTNTIGVINMLGLAKRVGAKFLLTSTSEVYGDPEVHPQPETYWGNVNPIGPRACYDEGKRIAETLVYGYAQVGNVSVRIARIFNTYGPRMNMNDGRVASNFVYQALQKKPITVYGDGSQTRSFQYIDDLVDGLVELMKSDYSKPVNIGNPDEHKIGDFAIKVRDAVSNLLGPEYDGEIVYKSDARIKDDPQMRRPDISLAKKVLDWEPKVTLEEGLRRTIIHFRSDMDTRSLSDFYQHSQLKID